MKLLFCVVLILTLAFAEDVYNFAAMINLYGSPVNECYKTAQAFAESKEFVHW